MKTLIAVALLIPLAGCAYLQGPSNYVASNGQVYETTPEMAHLMVARDVAIAHEEAVWKMAASTDTPEKAVTLAVFAMKGPQQIQQPKSIAEQWLPWAQILNPWLMSLTGAYGRHGGGASASGQGAALSLTNSDNNTFLLTTKPDLVSSNYYPGLTATNTRTTTITGGEENQAGSGTFTRDQSTETTTTTTAP